MDVNKKKYKRKLSERDPQDQFEGGAPGDGCADNGREMYPNAKERRKVFGQEVGAGDTLGCRRAGTDKESHSLKQKRKKRKLTASLQVDLQIKDLVNSREQSLLLQEGGTCLEKSSCELGSEKSLGLNGAQEMTRTRSSKSKKGLQAKKSGVGKEAALQYLHLWDNNRSCWCFR